MIRKRGSARWSEQNMAIMTTAESICKRGDLTNCTVQLTFTVEFNLI